MEDPVYLCSFSLLICTGVKRKISLYIFHLTTYENYYFALTEIKSVRQILEEK